MVQVVVGSGKQVSGIANRWIIGTGIQVRCNVGGQVVQVSVACGSGEETREGGTGLY